MSSSACQGQGKQNLILSFHTFTYVSPKQETAVTVMTDFCISDFNKNNRKLLFLILVHLNTNSPYIQVREYSCFSLVNNVMNKASHEPLTTGQWSL